MFNLSNLRRVFDRLNENCYRLAAKSGQKFNDQILGKHVFPKRKTDNSISTGVAQFRAKLNGAKAIKANEIELFFAGYRRTLHDLALGDPDDPLLDDEVRKVEEVVLNEFGLAHIGSHLTASMFILPTYESDDRTPALSAHDPMHIRGKSDLIKSKLTSIPDDKVFDQLCHDLDVIVIDTRPESADLAQLEVLSDSIVYDNTDWEAMPSKIDLRTRPVQACYCTRVLRVINNDHKATSISLEFNTNGFAVVPVPCRIQDSPKFRILVQDQVCMTEAPTPTRTTYVEFDLDPSDVGKELVFVVHSVFYNGLQDSIRATDEDENPIEVEWHGKRVAPHTVDADMAVILPASETLKHWRFNKRPESADRDIIQEPDDRERILESSMQRAGSSHEGIKAIWKIPEVNEPTIFSFQWSWD